MNRIALPLNASHLWKSFQLPETFLRGGTLCRKVPHMSPYGTNCEVARATATLFLLPRALNQRTHVEVVVLTEA